MPPTQVPLRPCLPARFGRWLALLCTLLWAALPAAEEAARRHYDIPAGAAVVTLKRAAQQAGLEIVYSAAVMQGIQTQPVVGEFTPREALERMVTNTPLKIFPDPQTGALSILRASDPDPQPPPPPPPPNSMKTPSGFRRATAWLALALSPVLSAQTTTGSSSQPAGSVSGSVSNSATKNLLEGARVEIPALGLGALVDSTGRYVLSAVPTGSHEVIASYLGLTQTRSMVTVTAGERARRDFELTAEIYKLSEFKVTGEREGSAAAITAQRNASNLTNVVETDSFGNLPNLSVGEMLIRLPGVAASNLDQEGNVTGVSVRGMPNSLNSVNMDGGLIANQGGLGRNFQMHTLSGALFERVELTKGLRPDKGADSLGGTIDFKTRSPLNMSEKRRITYRAAVRWAPGFLDQPGPLRDGHRSHPLINFSYQEVFGIFGGERNFAVAANLFYSENASSAFYTTRDFQNTAAEPAYVWDYRTQEHNNNRTQKSGNVKMEYRSSPNSKFSLNFQFGNNNEPAHPRWETRAYSAQSVGTTGTAGIFPGYTERVTQVRAASGSTIDITNTQNSLLQRLRNLNFGGEHKFDRVQIDYNALWSTGNINALNGKGAVFTMRLANVGWILDRTQSDLHPRFVQTEGPDFTNPANYRPAPDGLSRRHNDQDHRVAEVRGNVRYQPLVAQQLFLKTGFQVREQRVNNSSKPRRWSYVGTAPLPADPTIRLYDTEKTGRMMPQWESAAFMKDGVPADPSLWREDIYFREQSIFTGLFAVRERATAGYLMAEGRLGKEGLLKRTGFLAGVRTEKTETESYGWVRSLVPSTAAQRLADPVGSAQRDYAANRRENNGEYTKSFPSVHLSQDVTRNLKARVSWSTGFGRPPLSRVTPAETVNATTQSVTTSNPSLLPQTSRNWDVTLEYYFEPVGNFSVGWFRKNIRDYIVDGVDQGTIGAGANNGFNGEYVGYTLLSASNAGNATVEGWEASYQQQFTFLPGLLKGLAFSGNYTWLETQGNYGGTTRRSGGAVAGFIPRTGNATLSWRYRGYGARVSYNYTSDYLRAYSAGNPQRDRYQAPRSYFTSYGVSYQLRPTITLNCDVDNNAPQRIYLGIPDRMQQTFLNGYSITMGVSGRF